MQAQLLAFCEEIVRLQHNQICARHRPGWSHTIWDTIQNTTEDPDSTLYLVRDEAHRGVQGTSDGRQTIVTRLIGGKGSVSGMPIVLGNSATVERFNSAIAEIPGPSRLPKDHRG